MSITSVVFLSPWRLIGFVIATMMPVLNVQAADGFDKPERFKAVVSQNRDIVFEFHRSLIVGERNSNTGAYPVTCLCIEKNRIVWSGVSFIDNDWPPANAKANVSFSPSSKYAVVSFRVDRGSVVVFGMSLNEPKPTVLEFDLDEPLETVLKARGDIRTSILRRAWIDKVNVGETGPIPIEMSVGRSRSHPVTVSVDRLTGKLITWSLR